MEGEDQNHWGTEGGEGAGRGGGGKCIGAWQGKAAGRGGGALTSCLLNLLLSRLRWSPRGRAAWRRQSRQAWQCARRGAPEAASPPLHSPAWPAPSLHAAPPASPTHPPGQSTARSPPPTGGPRARRPLPRAPAHPAGPLWPEQRAGARCEHGLGSRIRSASRGHRRPQRLTSGRPDSTAYAGN